MTIKSKYLEALKALNGWATVSDWAIKFGELYPDLLDKANKEAKKHKKPSTGLREIAARISSGIASGHYIGVIEINDSERPRTIRYLEATEAQRHQEQELEDDLAPLSRAQREREDYEKLTVKEKYRLEEMQNIIQKLKSFFGLDFEFEHAKALFNKTEPGRHHPDNIQILLKSHNRNKRDNNWERFSLEEQIEYIKAVVLVQKIVSKRMNIELDEEVLKQMIDRIKVVY